jgi:hypothetical protein
MNKELSFKKEEEDEMEKDPKQLKVRYSIETYEKLLVSHEKLLLSHE